MEKGNMANESASAVFYSSSVIIGNSFTYYNATKISVFENGDFKCSEHIGSDDNNLSCPNQKKAESADESPDKKREAEAVKMHFVNRFLAPL